MTGQQHSNQLLHYLDNISDVIWLIDENLSIAYVTSSVARLLGALPGELIGRSSAYVIHPDDMDMVNNAQRYVMEHPGESHTIQYRVGHKDGRWVYVESTGVNMLGDPAINGVLVTMRDITGRKLAEEALRASEHRYRLLVESSPFCIHEIDLEGRLQSMNRAGLDMLGLDDAKKICGMPYLGAVSRQDAGRVETLLQDAISNGTPSHFEFASTGDAPLYFKSCFIPIKDAGGKMLKLMGITEDITERKLAEINLQASEASMRAILNNSPYLVWLKNTEGRYLKVNKAYADYARLKDARQITGKTDLDFWPKELAEKYRADDAEVMAARQQKRIEEPSFDGSNMHWVETFKTPVIDGNGNVLGTTGFARDITERKQAEAELRIAATAFESQDGMIVTDANNVILRVNHAFTGITGYTAEEAVGQTPRLLKSDRHDAAFYAAMWKDIRRTGTWHGEIWNRRKNGELYPERLTITAVKESAGEVTHYVATLRDITEQKRVEEALQESEALLQATMKILPVGLWIVNEEGRIVFGNDAGKNIWAGAHYVGIEQFGEYKGWWLDSGKLIEPHEWSAARAIKKGETSIEEEIEIECFDGTHKIILNSSLPLVRSDGRISGAVIVNQDITGRKKAEEQIRALAFYDALTGLPNRRLLNDRLTHTMAASKRSGLYGALIFLDMDNFKPLNDTHGHEVGDLLLIEVAHRITGCVREADTVVRFGGDEFVVVLGELSMDKVESAAQAGAVAEKIRAALSEPYVLEIHRENVPDTIVEHRCTSSIGVALFINHDARTEDIIKWADLAMYQAKEGGRNRICFHR